MKRLVCWVAVILLAGLGGWAGEAAAASEPFVPPSENIALGASYTFSIPPNYELCTEAEDVKQLTDGVYTAGHFWTQPSTVGWKQKGPIITLDLGADKPIRGASYNTAAGVAGVAWPAAIFMFVAGEDKQFREAGNLVALSVMKHGMPQSDGYGIHRYWTDELKTHGRYVAFVVSAKPYAFVDEIEVYAGDPEWVNIAYEGEPIADVTAYVASSQVRDGILQRVLWDVAAVRLEAAKAALPEDKSAPILAELAAIEGSVGGLPVHYGDEFRAVLPVNPLHERVFLAQAQLWAARGFGPLTVWQSGLWDPLTVVDTAEKPEEGAHGTVIGVHMMCNEYRAGSFNLSNATQAPMTVEVRILDLPGGVNPPYVTVHEVLWTDTSHGEPVVAALPPAMRQGGAYVVSVTPGLVRQVWLTFHPVDVAPGTYEGRVQVTQGETAFEVPLGLYLYPFRFPDRATLHLGGWDYTDTESGRGVTPQNREALIAHLRERFVDSPWATSGVMPAGEYDDAGVMTAPPSTERFDKWLQLWPNAGQYCVFSAVGSSFLKWPIGTPQFDTAVGAWAQFWAEYVKGKGIAPEQVCLLIVDEPSQNEQDAVILAWAKAIHAANTGLKVWEDPIYRDMAAANQEMIAACDVLCPNRPMFLAANQAYRDYFAEQHAKGIALDFYSCSGPARLLDPYSYYRLQAWTCWVEGARSSHFWAFGDNAGISSWNEYLLPNNAYTPVFLDATSVTAAKEMEACRESVEDYEYLVMLRDAIAAAEAKGFKGPALDDAKKLLAELPGKVLEAGTKGSLSWRVAMDRSVADLGRIQILNALVALRQAQQPPQAPPSGVPAEVRS